MRKGWLYYSIVITLVASLVAYTILALMTGIAAGHNQLLDILSVNGTLGGVTYDLFTLTNSPFFLAMIAILLLELLCGVLSLLFTMSAEGNDENGLMAAIVAGLLPALALGVFMFNSWRNGVAQYEAGTYVRPMEPAPDFMAIGVIVVLMAVCLMASVAGSWLARVALGSKPDPDIQRS